MKETKFRAWDKKEKKFVSKGFVLIDGSGQQYWLLKDLTWLMPCKDKALEIMYLTSKKDTKGIDVYEGDILKTNKDVFFLVIFSPKSARWVGVTANVWTDKPYVGKYIYKTLPWLAERGEIVGNIYEKL